MKKPLIIPVAALALIFGVGTILAQNPRPKPQGKEALLIANGDYSHFGKLPTPISDARLLQDTLLKIGFHVSLVENASREGMLDALGSFEDRLKASRGMAFFHYGGHGIQVDGKNFLIPADADIPDEKRVATRAVELDEVIAALDASGATVNVIVLDACRDNPLPATSTRSLTRGLTVVARKPKNSIIIYAAEAGCKAQDGLFTPTLAKVLAASHESDISDVMKQVRKEVYEQSGGSQTPGEYNQLFERVSLFSSGSVGSSNVVIPQPNAPSVGPLQYESPRSYNSDEEELPLSQVSSYWNHNGSVMGLISEGKNRTFIYVKPRKGMEDIVRPGMILFSGSADNNSYQGIARRFSKGLKPNLYEVSGQIKQAGSQVVLNGVASLRNSAGLMTASINDTLIFNRISHSP